VGKRGLEGEVSHLLLEDIVLAWPELSLVEADTRLQVLRLESMLHLRILKPVPKSLKTAILYSFNFLLISFRSSCWVLVDLRTL